MTRGDDVWLIWSNEHRAWWGPGRHGYTTLTDRAGRYSRQEAAEIVGQANIVPRLPPNEVAVLAPRPIRTGHPYDPTEPMPIWAEGDAEPDLSDIPELDEEWFKKARLLKKVMCTKEAPWDGTSAPGTMILHPDMRVIGGGVRFCPNCGFEWPPEVA
jgi:hypothetical protein